MRIHWMILLLLLSAPSPAETHRFGPDDAPRLVEAFEKLQSGDRVILEAGRYPLFQSLVISGVTDLRLEGRGKVELILQSLEQPVLTLDRCQKIRINNLRARHQQPSEEYVCEGAVIEVQKSQKVKIWDCHLNGCGAAGVYAVESDGLVIQRNRIFNNTYAGIWLHSSNAHVIDNKIFDNAASLITWGPCRLTLLGNEIKNNTGNDYTGAYEIDRWFEK